LSGNVILIEIETQIKKMNNTLENIHSKENGALELLM